MTCERDDDLCDEGKCPQCLAEEIRDWMRGIAFTKDSIGYLNRYGDLMDRTIDALVALVPKDPRR